MNSESSSRTSSFGLSKTNSASARSSKRNSRNDDFISIDQLRKDLYEKGIMSPQKNKPPAAVPIPQARSRSQSQSQSQSFSQPLSAHASTTSISPMIKHNSNSTSQLSSLWKRPIGHERAQSTNSVKKSPRKTNNKLVSEFYSDSAAVTDANTKQDQFSDLVYSPFDQEVKSDQELTNYLLNIDTIVKDLYHEDSSDEEEVQGNEGKRHFISQSKKLQPLLKTLEAVNKSINNHDFEQSQPISSIKELNSLFGKLKTIEQHSNDLNTIIQQNTNDIDTKYRPEIKQSVQKLNDLVCIIDDLEKRLNKIKANLKESKNLNDYYQSIELLEYVHRRFYQYTKETNKTRFKQLNVFISLSIVGISLWLWWGFKM